jgi:hypothetical protein
VVRKNRELAPFQQMAKMQYAAVYCQQFSIKGAITLLRRRQFLREKTKRLPALSWSLLL